MKTLSSLGLGTSLIAATVTAATVVAVAPAQAAGLKGDLNLSGNITITNDGDNFSWAFSENVVNINTLDFGGLSFPTDGSLPSIANLDFTCTPVPFSALDSCSTDPVTAFITFGEQTINGVTDNLTFNLDATQYVHFTAGNTGSTAAFPQITGSFMFDGSTLAEGTLFGSYSGSNSRYDINLSAEVPEPLTTLGTGLALGFGGLFQRKHSSKRKNKKQA